MANKIILKKSSVAAKVPLSTDLDVGEIAVNLADQKLYSKNAAGTVVVVGNGIAGTGTVSSVGGTGTVNGITLTGTVTTTGNLTLGGALSGVNLTTQVTGTLPATNGGTGQSTYAVGDLLVGGASNTLVKLADVATGNALISGGVGVAPAYGKIGLTTHVSGTLPIANGGTGNTIGSAATLTTARTINGTSFNGSANITTANWGTARTLWGQSVDGSANITAPLLPAAGTVALPAFSTSGDTNTGMYFPAADTIGFAAGGVIGFSVGTTASAVNYLEARGAATGNSPRIVAIGTDANVPMTLLAKGTGEIRFNTNSLERARIDGSGNVFFGTTTNPTGNSVGILNMLVASGDGINFKHTVAGNNGFNIWQTGTTAFNAVAFYKGDTQVSVGAINCTTTATAYNTTSDYRLKENVLPMTGALAKVAALKPCTYTWKSNGAQGQGFIAHELQAVVPDAVTGAKDAIGKDGKPIYQGVDTSFLVATLVAAIQELKAEFDEYKATHP